MQWIILVVAMLLLITLAASFGDSGVVKQWLNKPLSTATISDIVLIAFGVVLFVK